MKRTMKRRVTAVVLSFCMALALAACGSSDSSDSADEEEEATVAAAAEEDTEEEEQEEAQPVSDTDFPTGNISCIVPFAAGGGTDNLGRLLTTLAEDKLGVSFVVDNMTGASGATGTVFVNEQAADGYTLLISAENAAFYDALDISDVTYEDLENIFLIGDETVFVIVKSDSPYESITDLISDALDNPGTVTKPVAGSGGLAAVIDSLIKAVTGAELVQVPSDGDSDALLQLLSGEVDCAVGKMSTISDYYEDGQIRLLCVMTEERLDAYPDVPSITEEYPGFSEYLPWGSFYSVCAPAGTPSEVVDILAEAFEEAYNEEEFQTFMEENAITGLGLTGEDAADYISTYRKNVVSALIDAGTISYTLEELGIE